MANTQPVRLSYTIQDELGTKASETFYALVDPASTVTQLAAEWQALASLIAAVSDGGIPRGSIALLEVPTAPITPAAGSRVEQTGLFNFSNNVTPHRFGEAVPALKDSVIVGGKINLADTGVAALVAALATTFNGGLGVFTTNNAQALVALVDAVLSFRKRRRQLSRSSFEL
jgi:hypothetical protein